MREHDNETETLAGFFAEFGIDIPFDTHGMSEETIIERVVENAQTLDEQQALYHAVNQENYYLHAETVTKVEAA